MKSDDTLRADSLLSADEIRLLAGLGFMAARAGHVVPALRLFEGLAVLRPDKPFVYVGMALALLCVGACGDAVEVLRARGLRACPDDPEVRAYLSLALQLAGCSAEAAEVMRGLRASEEGDGSGGPTGERDPGLQAVIATVARLASTDRVSGGWPRPASVTGVSKQSDRGKRLRHH